MAEITIPTTEEVLREEAMMMNDPKLVESVVIAGCRIVAYTHDTTAGSEMDGQTQRTLRLAIRRPDGARTGIIVRTVWLP